MKYLAVVFLIFSSSVLANNKWELRTTTDAMTDVTQHYVYGPNQKALTAMKFPYADARSSIMIGCSENKIWTYFWFSSINLNSKSGNRYRGGREYYLRIKWDSEIAEEKLVITQDTGSDALHITDDESFVEMMKKHNKVLIELDWYGNGKVYFEYSLKGATKVINEMAKSCYPKPLTSGA